MFKYFGWDTAGNKRGRLLPLPAALLDSHGVFEPAAALAPNRHLGAFNQQKAIPY